MKEKCISIIIPVYNAEKYLSTLLNNIISNKEKLTDLVEIILVDDGSTDKSGSICDKYAFKYSFVKVIHQKNQGQSVARNVALDIACGKWITFVDSDDIVRINYLSLLLANIKNNKEADIIIFRYRSFSDENSDQEKINRAIKYSPKKVSILSKSAAMYYITTDEIGNYMWNKIFKRRLFDGIRFPVGRRFEDIAILYKCMQLAKKIYLYNDCLYFYRERLNSTTHVNGAKENVRLLKEAIISRSEQLEFFKRNNYYRAYKNASHAYVIHQIYYIIRVNNYRLPKDEMYGNAQNFIHTYTPKIKEGIKCYLFVKLYNMFPKLVEKSLQIITFN